MTAQESSTEAKTLSAQVDWEAIYADQLPRVYNLFRYWTGDNALAEDLTSATFEKAWKQRLRYRQDVAAFSTWLFTVARHIAIDYFRQRHVEVALNNAVTLVTEDQPDAIAERRSDFERLSQLLSQLPTRERELIALKYGAELTHREIADLTGLSETNVGTLLNRTVQKLRAAWKVDL
jgi:RNA polymerase sigma-70 factor (ECF subfamily)